MPIRHLMAIAAGGVLIAAVPLSPMQAQAKPVHVKTDSITADNKFIREVAADNLLEVRLGDLAQRKATAPDVKHFAQRMVTDHQKFQDQWTDMASKHGMVFKPALGRRHEQKLDRLQHADAKAFDQAYMTAMIQGHMDDVDYFRKEGMSAQSEPVRKLVAYGLPLLQEHLRSARQIGKEVGVDSATVARSRHAAARK
jgi:putative membrane protein